MKMWEILEKEGIEKHHSHHYNNLHNADKEYIRNRGYNKKMEDEDEDDDIEDAIKDAYKCGYKDGYKDAMSK